MRFNCEKIISKKTGETVAGILMCSALVAMLGGAGYGMISKQVVGWSIYAIAGASFAAGLALVISYVAIIAAACGVCWLIRKGYTWLKSKLFPVHDWKEFYAWYPVKVRFLTDRNVYYSYTSSEERTKCVWFETVLKKRDKYETQYVIEVQAQ